MVVGLYFGSFNPVHQGHVRLALAFQQQAQVDEVWWVLSPHNPFKQLSDLAPFEHRCAMIDAVLPINHTLCSIEDGLPKPSYTIQTLRALQSQFIHHQWVILMGADSWNALPTWKDGSTIESEFPIWVYPRKEEGEVVSHLRQGNCKVLSGDFIPVSSTAIRQAVAEKHEKPNGVAAVVWDYMIEHQLY